MGRPNVCYISNLLYIFTGIAYSINRSPEMLPT